MDLALVGHAALIGLGLAFCLYQVLCIAIGFWRGTLWAPWGLASIHEPGVFGFAAALHLGAAAIVLLLLQHYLAPTRAVALGVLWAPIHLGFYVLPPAGAFALRMAAAFLAAWVLFFVIAAFKDTTD